MKFSPEILSPQLEIILSIQSLFLQFIGRMVIKKKKETLVADYKACTYKIL